jgi:hypothetical protein
LARLTGIGTPRAFADAGSLQEMDALWDAAKEASGQPRRKRADLITNPRSQPSAFP